MISAWRVFSGSRELRSTLALERIRAGELLVWWDVFPEVEGTGRLGLELGEVRLDKEGVGI